MASDEPRHCPYCGAGVKSGRTCANCRDLEAAELELRGDTRAALRLSAAELTRKLSGGRRKRPKAG